MKKVMDIRILHQLSKDLFILFCALNAFGYDDENNKRGMHPIRKKVRKCFLKNNIAEKYPQLEKILKNAHPYGFILKIFSKKSLTTALILNLKKFSKEPIIQNLWEDFKKIQQKETEKMFPIFKKEMFNLTEFLNKLSVNIKKIIFINNLLDAYWRGYGFKINNIGYVIVGPGANKNNGELIRHELLHILSPHFNMPPEIIKKTQSLLNMGYGDQKIINKEYTIRSLNLIYESKYHKKSATKMLKNEQKYFPKIKEAIKIIKQKLKRAAD